MTGYAAAAEVALTLWESSDGKSAERDKLVRLAQQACAGLRAFAGMFPIGQPQAWLWEGLRDWLSNKPSKAHTAWEKSLTLAERLQMPYEEGLAHLEIGRHTPPGASQRRSHLMRAGEIFSQLAARHHQARVQIALDAAAPASVPPPTTGL